MSAGHQQIVATLMAAFPRAAIPPESLKAYVLALRDLPVEELGPVANAWACDAEWFPTIRELRRGVIERRLGLPGPEEAWELARQVATTPRRHEPCNLCLGRGESQESGERCPGCGGNGENEVAVSALRGKLPEPVAAALAFVSVRSIRESDRPDVVRAQFVKAYLHARDEHVRAASLGSAGLGELVPAMRAIEPAR